MIDFLLPLFMLILVCKIKIYVQAYLKGIVLMF